MSCMRALILGSALALALGTDAASALAKSAVPQQAAPACTPASLDNSALQDRTVTISPLPGARDAAPQTQISFLGVPAAQLRVLSVVGSRTGAHTGRLQAYSQGDGASFLPARPFAEGERVTVRALLSSGHSTHVLLDRFAIATQDAISSTPEAVHPGSESEVQHFHTRPDLRPPVVTVTAQSPSVAGGDELLTPAAGPGQSGPMILDPSGGLVWFKALPPGISATNLQVQQYAGRPVLTWWQGDISEHGFGLGEDVIADQSYTDIAHVRAGNGHQADLHEFQLTAQGTALITAYYPILCNLSAVGGPAHGALTDAVFQEIDVTTGLVMYEWTSVDHVAIAESEERAATSSTSWPFDFFHLNSIGFDQDGTLLVSSRNTWTVYDVDPRSGQILWRLGGRRSTFKLAPGAATAFQHDPRELPDGDISEFDNGASPKVHAQSRAVVLSLDRQHATATLVSQFTHTPPLLSESQGSVQALANGDWFVGWGQEPYFSEFGPEGQLLFDAHLPAHDRSYRAFRSSWTGMPAHPPALAFQPAGAGPATVYASWNGATLVSSWRVLAGGTPATLVPVAQVARSGFETAIGLPSGTVGPDVAVQALGAGGEVLGTSATAAQPGL
jgi:Arylsulfotransferase (ASST)